MKVEYIPHCICSEAETKTIRTIAERLDTMLVCVGDLRIDAGTCPEGIENCNECPFLPVVQKIGEAATLLRKMIGEENKK